MLDYIGAPATRRTTKRSNRKHKKHACIEIENHATLFLKVNMASGVDRGRLRPTRTTSLNIAAILQLITIRKTWFTAYNPDFSNLQGKQENKKSWVKLQCSNEERERLLARVIGRFEKKRV